MIGLIILGVYILGYLAFVRPLAWALASDSIFGNEPGTDDLIFGLVFGLFLALVWPISGTIYLLARRKKLGLLLKPRDVRREDEVKALKGRIRDLERETGITH